MNSDVELHIRLKFPWQKLPVHVKQLLGNSVEEYEKCIVNFSIRNQLRHKGNLVRSVMKDEKRYYEILLQYSREHLMLFPYHLSDVTVKGLRMTPFQYYIGMMMDLMTQEKSYDSLPNFTAADCLRLLGIGRNQYLDLMNQCRSVKKLFRRKPLRDLLPIQPIADITMEPWWIAQVGYVTEDDIKVVLPSEKVCIDKLIDDKCCKAGELPFGDIYGLYRKGLVYLDVPIEDEDFIIVPPLEGFVMNRVMGDYFETLLYKIFVSIDENTTIAELANILQIDLQLVKNAVSMYCRLGIAYPKGKDADSNDWHPSWAQYKARSPRKPPQDGVFLLDFNSQHFSETKIKCRSSESSSQEEQDSTASTSTGHCKRIALLFDSTLTAFLMMGNLSSGLKSHAVTMFEVGKLPDESLDSLLSELEKVADVGEGEAQRYFDHALTLRSTVLFLRHNRDLFADINPSSPLGLDLIRCESLQNLEADACSRLLNKNYVLLVSMAPLSHEIRPISIGNPHHLGPAIPEVNTLWFKLFVYQLTGSGPPSLLLAKGTRLRCMPKVLLSYDHLLVTTWGHDPGVVPSWNALISLNDALTHSAVLVQAYRKGKGREILHIPFPLNEEHSGSRLPQWVNDHAAVRSLASKVDLRHCCGYVTLLNLRNPCQAQTQETKANVTTSAAQSPKNGFRDQLAAEVLAAELDTLTVQDANEGTRSSEPDESDSNHDDVGQAELGEASDFVLLECCFGLPLFDPKLNADICDRISSRKLCSKESLDSLTASSCTMANELLDFITGIQDSKMVNSTADITSKLMGSGCVSTPQRNMIFYEGKLEPWNGR